MQLGFPSGNFPRPRKCPSIHWTTRFSTPTAAYVARTGDSVPGPGSTTVWLSWTGLYTLQTGRRRAQGLTVNLPRRDLARQSYRHSISRITYRPTRLASRGIPSAVESTARVTRRIVNDDRSRATTNFSFGFFSTLSCTSLGVSDTCRVLEGSP